MNEKTEQVKLRRTPRQRQTQYLKNLPIPKSISGWSQLEYKDWLALAPPIAATVGLCYISYKAFWPNCKTCKQRKNEKIRELEMDYIRELEYWEYDQPEMPKYKRKKQRKKGKKSRSSQPSFADENISSPSSSRQLSLSYF